MMRNEVWRDGELVEVIETPDDEIETENIETKFAIPQTAIEGLQTQLTDPATNSIAKVKTALINFFEEIQGA